MGPLLEKLFELHKQHSVLSEFKEKARGLQAAMAAKERQVARLKTELEKLSEHRKKTQRAADGKELEVKTVQGKMAKMKEQLNVIKNNKEYQALQNELKFAGIELRHFEDDELALLDQHEQDGKQIDETRAALKRAEDELAESRSRTAAELDTLEAQIGQAESDRAAVVEHLPSHTVAVFDRVAARHHNGAMCPLVTDADEQQEGTYSCGGCHMRLTQNAYVKLLGNTDDIITCPNCSRILYLEL